MNSLERYLGVVRGERVDFLPRLPILMQYAAEHIGAEYGSFAADHRVLVEANRRMATDFGLDQLNTMSDPYRETQGFGAQIVYMRDGVPRCPHPPLAEHKDLAALGRPNPRHSERMRDRLEAVRAYREYCGGRFSVMGWVEGPAAEAADLRGVTAFLIDLLDDEAFVGELMDRCVEVAIDFARAQVEEGAETIGIGDAIASQVSPALYERLIQPREKRLVQAIKGMGALVRLHICGDITHLLPGIAELGIHIADVDHMVDMARARRVLGGGVVLTGNLDPAGGVLFGEPAAIRRQVLRTYAEVGNPYMVNAGCEIPPGTPPANLRALCEPVPYRP
ncbi:MAG: uroporphyrinogen decarboxylase family protein [Candidatus Latescibacteria bacterium]|nr:uroporphyrinogen decarboxylase family protein [Candidatus Latescibacterota bacterium]